MIITTKRVYVFDGLEYKNLDELQAFIRNQIGISIGNPRRVEITPDIAMLIIKNIIENKETLKKLLSLDVRCFHHDDMNHDHDIVNVLDAKESS